MSTRNDPRSASGWGRLSPKGDAGNKEDMTGHERGNDRQAMAMTVATARAGASEDEKGRGHQKMMKKDMITSLEPKKSYTPGQPPHSLACPPF
jgi:hypothetical protein